jgi:hypothetical protein
MSGIGSVRPVLGDERESVRRRDACVRHGGRRVCAVHEQRELLRNDACLQYRDAPVWGVQR